MPGTGSPRRTARPRRPPGATGRSRRSSPVGGSGLTGSTGTARSRIETTIPVTKTIGRAHAAPPSPSATARRSGPPHAHRRPVERAGIDDEEPDEPDVDRRLDGHRDERPERAIERDADEARAGSLTTSTASSEIGTEANEDQERRRPLVRQPAADAPLDRLRAGARDEPDGQRDRGRRPQDRGAAADRCSMNPTAMSPIPTMRGQPADDEQRRRGATLDGERAGPEPGRRRAGIRRRRRLIGLGRVGIGRVGVTGQGPSRPADRPLAGPRRTAGPRRSTLRQRILRGAGTGPVAGRVDDRPPVGNVVGIALEPERRRRAGRLARGGDGRHRAARQAPTRPAPHDVRSPCRTRRTATSPSRPGAAVRADAVQAGPAGGADDPLVVDRGARRSGQWWIDSTSARSASSARLRSQTSPIFSCGRTIL